VATRREEILDAAISVLGRHGVRAVTHRAVDAEAGLPMGSTSNYFRSRDTLFDGVVERFAAREREAFDEIAAAAHPTSPRDLAEVLAAFVLSATGPRRELTVARFALLVEGAIRPSLQRRLASEARHVSAWAESWMRAVGSANPARDIRLLGGQVEALTLHQLAYPDPAFDPTSTLLELTTALAALGTIESDTGDRA
jgi:DNA-binding transcriptional regulator YbjK